MSYFKYALFSLVLRWHDVEPRFPSMPATISSFSVDLFSGETLKWMCVIVYYCFHATYMVMQNRCVWSAKFLLGPFPKKHNVPMYARLGQKLVMKKSRTVYLVLTCFSPGRPNIYSLLPQKQKHPILYVIFWKLNYKNSDEYFRIISILGFPENCSIIKQSEEDTGSGLYWIHVPGS